MANWICEECGGPFRRDKAGARPIRFCGGDCFHAWQKRNPNSGQFDPGSKPWNAGVKGTHFSPSTEFKAGRRGENWLPVGSVTERVDKGGNTRAHVKIAEPNKWRERAIVVWENFHGMRLPKGSVVHHKDRNPLNDAISNLQALTRAEHISVHREDLQEAKRLKVAA